MKIASHHPISHHPIFFLHVPPLLSAPSERYTVDCAACDRARRRRDSRRRGVAVRVVVRIHALPLCRARAEGGAVCRLPESGMSWPSPAARPPRRCRFTVTFHTHPTKWDQSWEESLSLVEYLLSCRAFKANANDSIRAHSSLSFSPPPDFGPPLPRIRCSSAPAFSSRSTRPTWPPFSSRVCAGMGLTHH